MARPTVTFEEVKSVAEALVSKKERPTINRVKEMLDGRGSPVTISRHLKEWRQSTGQTVEPVSVEVQTRAPLGSGPKPEAPAPKSENSSPKDAPSPKEEPASEEQVQKSRGHKPKQENNTSEEGGDDKPSGKEGGREHRGGKDRHHNNKKNGRRHQNNNRDRHNNKRSQSQQSQEPAQITVHYLDYYTVEHIEGRTEEELVAIVRRLEAMLVKEQSRREVAEKLTQEAKDYAEIIKEQVSKRINDLKHVNETTVDQLKQELVAMKASAEQDLAFYREQLGKANQELLSLKGLEVDLLTDTLDEGGE